MDWRIVLFPFEVRHLSKEFEDWRKEIVHEANKWCLEHQQIPLEKRIRGYFQVVENLRTFPKTIVRLTRQMCSCNDYCTRYSLFYTDFTDQCKYYNVTNLLDDDTYYSSTLNGKKVIYRRIEDRDYVVDVPTLRNEIYEQLWDLCNDKKNSFKKLKCKTYELKDYCNNNETCFRNILNEEMSSIYDKEKLRNGDCINKRYSNDLKNLEKKVSLPPIFQIKKVKRDLFNLSVNTKNEQISDGVPIIILFLGILCFVMAYLIFKFNKLRFK